MKSAIDFEDSLGKHTHVRKQKWYVFHIKTILNVRTPPPKKKWGWG